MHWSTYPPSLYWSTSTLWTCPVDTVLSYGSTVIWYDVKYSYRVAWYAVKNVRKGIVKNKVVKNVVVTKEVDTKPTPTIDVKPTSTIDAKPTPMPTPA